MQYAVFIITQIMLASETKLRIAFKTLLINTKYNSAYLFFTYLLTPRSRVFLEKLTGSAASQEIPRIFGTRRFITVPTSAHHLSLS